MVDTEYVQQPESIKKQITEKLRSKEASELVSPLSVGRKSAGIGSQLMPSRPPSTLSVDKFVSKILREKKIYLSGSNSGTVTPEIAHFGKTFLEKKKKYLET